MIVFNIEKYGDFDMPHTVLVMIAPAGMNKKTARMVAKEAQELLKNTDDEQEAIAYLDSWGCVTANMVSVTIGGNL